MGGMFDPVHHGHLSTALSALQDLGLDQVRLVPCGSPVHREGARASGDQRIAMLRLAVRDEDRLVVDERECRSEAPSYMINTLESLAAEFPQSRFFLLLGADAFSHFDSWFRWRDILGLAHLLVISRPGWEGELRTLNPQVSAEREVKTFEALQAQDSGGILQLGFMPMMISSSGIRERLAAGQSVRFLLPDQVRDYIQDHHLYRGNVF